MSARCLYAQIEDTETVKWRNAALERGQKIDSLVLQVKGLQQELDSLVKWKDEIEAVRILNKTLKPRADSLEQVRKEVDRLKEAIDMSAAKYCYVRLGQKFRYNWVNDALSVWKTISTPSVLERYKYTYEKLQSYEAYYREIRTILVKFTAPDKLAMAMNVKDLFQKEVRRELGASRYCKEAYKKADKSIPYLDSILDFVYSQLDQGKCDFTGCLDLVMPDSN